MSDAYICHDCQRNTAGDCGKHGPKIITFSGLDPAKVEPGPREELLSWVRNRLRYYSPQEINPIAADAHKALRALELLAERMAGPWGDESSAEALRILRGER